MKSKIYLLSAICMLSINEAQAQRDNKKNGFEDSRERFAFGLKAGLNASNVWDSEGEDFRADTKLGLAAGAFFCVPIGEYFGVQPEVLLSQKGFQGAGTLLGASYSFSRTTTYLDVPLQVQFKPTSFATLVAGPTFSYLLNQKDVYTFAGNSVEQEQEFDNDNIRKNILGATVGLDLNFSMFLVSARAAWDFQNNKGDGTSTTPRYKNQWLQLTVGFKI